MIVFSYIILKKKKEKYISTNIDFDGKKHSPSPLYINNIIDTSTLNIVINF